MKIVPIKGCDWFSGVRNVISISPAVYELSGFETLTIGHTSTHTHTSGRQLKITFLDVLDYSEYSDTNISKYLTLISRGSKKWKMYSKSIIKPNATVLGLRIIYEGRETRRGIIRGWPMTVSKCTLKSKITFFLQFFIIDVNTFEISILYKVQH